LPSAGATNSGRPLASNDPLEVVQNALPLGEFSMMLKRLAFFRPALLVILAGCAGASTAIAPGLDASSMRKPMDIFWGVGQSGFISIMTPKGLTEHHFEKTFCQVHKSSGCPLFSLGTRTAKVSLSKTQAWSGGSFSVESSAGTKLGAFAFNHTVSTTSNAMHIAQGVQANTMFAWTDVLTITSPSQPYGTTGHFKVTTTLKPTSIKVPCSKNDVESITFYFQSNGEPNPYETINGACIGSKFTFYIDTPGKKGTVAEDNVVGTVGQSLSIQGMGTVVSALCTPLECAAQSSTLAGAVTYKIVSTTPGISFKTASGQTYR
jgi:hypothetical protein